MRIGAPPSLMDSALSAMQSGERQMLQAAGPILSGDLDSLPAAIVDLNLGKLTHQMGVRLAQTADDVFQSTLDILA